MDPRLTLAIAKVIKPKELEIARADKIVTVGTHQLTNELVLGGTLIVAPDTPAGPVGELPGVFDPWVLVHLITCHPTFSTTRIVKKYAEMGAADRAQLSAAMKGQFDCHVEALPKVQSAGTPGKRGAVSFSGSILLKS